MLASSTRQGPFSDRRPILGRRRPSLPSPCECLPATCRRQVTEVVNRGDVEDILSLALGASKLCAFPRYGRDVVLHAPTRSLNQSKHARLPLVERGYFLLPQYLVWPRDVSWFGMEGVMIALLPWFKGRHVCYAYRNSNLLNFACSLRSSHEQIQSVIFQLL